MLKLYKYIDSELYYWETWEKDNRTAVVHWGKVGETGQSEELKSGFLSNFRRKAQRQIKEKRLAGYEDIPDDNFSLLEIQYKIEGFGSEQDLDRRRRLQEKMNQVLGWTGLGHCDGGSSGSDTMEVCCVVVDFEIAKRLIEKSLAHTEFSNYAGIMKLV